MAELGVITASEAKTAKTAAIKLGSIRSFRLDNPYLSLLILKELEAKFSPELVRKGGLKVQTSLDLDLQKKAQNIVTTGAAKLKNRRVSQMALVSVDPRTGFIKALVGGVDFKKSQFNRATQARRQPGSAFKPFVYYTAFASGKYTPDSSVVDAPISYGKNQRYAPRNYDGTFWGGMSIRRAVQFSRNVPAVKIANSIGVQNVIRTAKSLGMRGGWQPNLSVALGSVDVSPLELAQAYASFANGGFGVAATLLVQVTDHQGNILLDYKPQRQLILDPKAVDMTNDVLQAVVTGGTATRAQLKDKRPVAGKTGTTSDFRDAWFVGYVPQMVTVMWIGNDNYSPLASGTAGGTYIAPLWKQYMEQALTGQPVLSFPTANKASAVFDPKQPAENASGSAQRAARTTETTDAPKTKKKRKRTEESVESRPQRRSTLPQEDLGPEGENLEESFVP